MLQFSFFLQQHLQQQVIIAITVKQQQRNAAVAMPLLKLN
jgi:hypothetical protein